MLEEFVLLLESEKDKVKQVLWPHVHEKIYKRLIGGFFDDTQKRFIAFAFMPIKKSMFYEYDYLFELSNSGHSGIYLLPDTSEKTRKYIDGNTFQHKTAEELVEEGIYKSILVSYTAEYDFNEWNILRECTFCDTNDKTEILKSKVNRTQTKLKDYFFKSSIFRETLERHQDHIKFIKQKHENREMPLPTEMRPFVGHSQLVAFVRTKKASKLNQIFKDYINKAIFIPLIIKLKTRYPKEYKNVEGFYGQDCNFLIPSHRQFCLIIFIVTNNQKNPSLKFYFYNLQENKLYEWIYFLLHPYTAEPDYDIIVKMLSPISTLDNMDYVSKLDCNFDDDKFWENYVLKKDDDVYIYLKNMSFIGN